MSSPWDLQTALNQPASVQPGDTIWLRGGTYAGIFNSLLQGSSTAPIYVRQYQGERATIDGGTAGGGVDVLNVNPPSTYVWFMDFEVKASPTTRTSPSAGSAIANFPGGIYITSPDVKFIHVIVHDTGQGFSFWQGATDSELYGNIDYFNGWDAPDHGHGHGIYTQNAAGQKWITNNIILNQFGLGLQAYGSSAAPLLNYRVAGNTFFDNGVLSIVRPNEYEILIGGGQVAENPIVQNNYTYSGNSHSDNAMGYAAGCDDGVLQNNYFGGGFLTFNCTNTTVTGNTFDGGTTFTPSEYPDNTYLTQPPTGVITYVQPNQYEPGRANVTVYNWDNDATVAVNVGSAGLADGNYEVRYAQNYWSPQTLTVSGGIMTISMSGWGVATPIAWTAPPSALPQFGAFDIVALGNSGAPPPPPPTTTSTPILSPDGGSFAGSVVVSIVCTTPNSSIYYTTDGTNPSVNSPLYTGPFTLATSGTVKAQAYAAGFSSSTIVSASYTINTSGSPPPLVNSDFSALRVYPNP